MRRGAAIFWLAAPEKQKSLGAIAGHQTPPGTSEDPRTQVELDLGYKGKVFHISQMLKAASFSLPLPKYVYTNYIVYKNL